MTSDAIVQAMVRSGLPAPEIPLFFGRFIVSDKQYVRLSFADFTIEDPSVLRSIVKATEGLSFRQPFDFIEVYREGDFWLIDIQECVWLVPTGKFIQDGGKILGQQAEVPEETPEDDLPWWNQGL